MNDKESLNKLQVFKSLNNKISINIKKDKPDIFLDSNKLKKESKVLKNLNNKIVVDIEKKKPDIIINNKKKETKHVIKYKFNTNTKYKKNTEKYKIIKRIESNLYKYQNLFHKTILNIENKLKYDIIKSNLDNNFINNRYILHLHCYDLDLFDSFYGDYIENLNEYYSIYITFHKKSNEKNVNKLKNYTLIQIQNIGMDIGAKLVLLHYLNKHYINYTHILFLHSKTNEKQRKLYFDYFIGNKTQINYVCNIAPKYEILFPNIKIRGDWNRGFYFLNKNCYDEFNKLYNISHLTEYFIEGNVFMVSKKYIDTIFFNNDVIELFYKNLNTVNSFDSNWVSLYYKLKENSILDLYKVYKENTLYGNCLETKHLPQVQCYELLLSNKSIDNFYLPDANIEHVFERLWLNIAISFNYEYKILDYYEDNSKEMIDFDINIYKLLNHKTEFISSIENIYNLQKEIIQQSKEQKNNTIYSLHKILEYLPLDFNIQKYAVAHNLIEKNKYQIINHYIKNVINNNINLSKDTYFNNIEINKHINKNLTSFAILFPQFHELEVNNEIWGNGFTEWDNLKKNKLIIIYIQIYIHIKI